MMSIAQHTANKADIGEFGQPIGGTIAFVEHVLGFNVDAELGGGVDALRDRRVKTMQTVEKEDLVFLEFDGFAGRAAAFFETVNGLIDSFAIEQAGEMLIE